MTQESHTRQPPFSHPHIRNEKEQLSCLPSNGVRASLRGATGLGVQEGFGDTGSHQLLCLPLLIAQASQTPGRGKEVSAVVRPLLGSLGVVPKWAAPAWRGGKLLILGGW